MAAGDGGGTSAPAVDPAHSELQTSVGNRNVTVTAADRADAAKLYADLPADKRTPAELTVLRNDVAQNKYDSTINAAVTATRLRAPDAAIDPMIVKSLLYQESNFRADPGNRGNYQGIAQMGSAEARSHGLTVNATVDERLDPTKAIGAVPKILSDYDYAIPYSKYVKEGLGVTPQGDDRAKFYLAAYNGGTGTVSAAMRIAAADGKNPLDFQNLLAQPGQSIESSPLYKAIDTVLRKDAPSIDPTEKYDEISKYANDIVARAEAMHASVGQTQTLTPTQSPTSPTVAGPSEPHPKPEAPHPHAPTPHTPDTHAPTHTSNGTRGAYDRVAVRDEVGKLSLGKSSDLTNDHLTQRSLVDAMGNLEAKAGVPITVSVLNSGHGTSAVDNEHTHGHKAGYAADLYVTRTHDTPEARAKLVETIAKDPYVTKVGLGGDYNTAANREILKEGGKVVFADNNQSHVHIQSEIDPKKLAREESHDATKRPEPRIHVTRGGHETTVKPGSSQFGTISEHSTGDSVVQNIGGGRTATYSRKELLEHTAPADRAAVDAALKPGNAVEFSFGRQSVIVAQKDPQTQTLQPVVGQPASAPALPNQQHGR
jgi:hypothetical protein